MIDTPGTLAFNVPVGWNMLVDAIKDDPATQAHLCKDLQLLFYAGASLPQDVWEALEQFCIDARGGLPMMISSWGLTETAPACLMVHEPIGRSGVIGVPLPGVEVKLIPDEDMRCEVRVKGPGPGREAAVRSLNGAGVCRAGWPESTARNSRIASKRASGRGRS